VEISSVQQRSGIPFIYVTHNQREAVRLGSQMLLIDDGKIVQEGTPLEIFNAPLTAPAARILGTENIFAGKIQTHHMEDGTTTVDANSCFIELPYNGMPVGSDVTFGIRSEDIIVSRENLTQTSARNVLRGTIRNIIADLDKIELIVNCGIDFKVSVTKAAVRKLELETGSEVYLLIKARALHVVA
jgi:molybdopterin-binding protein